MPGQNYPTGGPFPSDFKIDSATEEVYGTKPLVDFTDFKQNKLADIQNAKRLLDLANVLLLECSK